MIDANSITILQQSPPVVITVNLALCMSAVHITVRSTVTTEFSLIVPKNEKTPDKARNPSSVKSMLLTHAGRRKKERRKRRRRRRRREGK